MNSELILSILKLVLELKPEAQTSSNQYLVPSTAPIPLSQVGPMIDKEVIIRTYSAGCWFGRLSSKEGREVILKNARRMWRGHAAEGISLSGCAIHGIKQEKSKIVEPVDSVWLEAIEIIPCTNTAADSIRGAKNVKAE